MVAVVEGNVNFLLKWKSMERGPFFEGIPEQHREKNQGFGVLWLMEDESIMLLIPAFPQVRRGLMDRDEGNQRAVIHRG
jgi:hypothetical protein